LKVQELANQLGAKLDDFFTFLNQSGFRRLKVSSKLDPGSVAKIKRLYKIRQEKEKESKEEVLEEKDIVFQGESVKVSELSELFGLPMGQIVKEFLKKGLMVNLNSEIDQETLIEVAKELNINVEIEDQSVEKEIGLKTKVLEIEEQSLEVNEKDLQLRPPIIAIMGHVDHGKTLLLDSIRKSNVISSESGGITQHIGAYQIEHQGNKLTFLDTPGHEAFTALRARGAQVTDIAILVVAADDGVKPQTIEAINHAQVADVPIIVAINKIDKPEANIDQVKQQLSQHNLVSEEWGGDTVMAPVSAKSCKGIDDLLEMINLVAEMQELRCNPSSVGKAVVIESKLSTQKGPVATVIVKAGSLKIGDYFVVDNSYGKVRAIFNDLNQKVDALYPGDPGEVLGFSATPQPGAIVEVKSNEKECKTYISNLPAKDDVDKSLSQKMSVSLEALSAQAQEGDLRQLNLILKADVHGSLEAIKGAIEKIETQDIPIKIIHFSTGSISENDVLLAKASNAIIFGFNVEPNSSVKKIADNEKIVIRTYSIIYEILDDINNVILGLFKVEYEDVFQAKVEIRELFKFSKVGTIAGCYVLEGKIDKSCNCKVMREGQEVFSGTIESLKRFKEDVKEVGEGFECGIVLNENFKLQIGDQIHAFKVKEVKVR